MKLQFFLQHMHKKIQIVKSHFVFRHQKTKKKKNINMLYYGFV